MTSPILWSDSPSPSIVFPRALALAAGTVVLTLALVVLSDSLSQYLPHPILVGLAFALYAVVDVSSRVALLRTIHWEVTAQRLRVTTGVFTTVTQELELRRVQDSYVIRPGLLRMFGVGTVALLTADPSTPNVALVGVKNPDAVQELIRDHVEQQRAATGVREVQVYRPT